MEHFGTCMGPLHSSSITLGTGIRPGSRPWTSRKVRVPLKQLSRSMQFSHQLGVNIEFVGFDYGNVSSVTTEPKAVKASVESAPRETAETTSNVVTQEAPSKPKRRRGRRKR